MLVEPSRTVEVAVPHGSRRVGLASVKISERRGLSLESLEVLQGCDPLRVTSAAQTVLDCCRTLPLLEAVVICDSALRSGDVSVTELRRAVASLRGLHEAAAARRVLELCDPECGSVLESVLRVRMHLDGIAGFATQRVLLDAAGRHVLRADFVFEGERLVVEVDGQKWHQDVERDRRRDNQLAALGWRVLRYRWAEVVHSPDVVLREIRQAVGQRTDDCQLLSVDLPAVA
jgi:very-short-patch-repair endonuclease